MTHNPKVSRPSKNKAVHRAISLTSPIMRGPDVEELQWSINHLVDHYQFDPWWSIIVDGNKPHGGAGPRTLRGAVHAAWLIGVDDSILKRMKAHHTVSEQVQKVIRNPQLRTREDHRREDQRKARREELRKGFKSGPDQQEAWLKKYVGVNEQPPESNHGPFPIDACQEYFNLSGAPWCGCLQGYGLLKVCGLTSVKDVWWPHAGFIKADAVAGRNGIHDTNPLFAKRGMIATFFNGGDDHVTWVRKDGVHNGIIYTIEGNTSSAIRDSDGGIIEEKERNVSEVTCMVVIEDWS